MPVMIKTVHWPSFETEARVYFRIDTMVVRIEIRSGILYTGAKVVCAIIANRDIGCVIEY